MITTLSVLSMLAPILLASLLGSAHCVGMCGGFVALYSCQAGASYGSHISYNIGRLTTYLLLGALLGAMGAKLNQLGMVAGIGNFTAIAVGCTLLSWGIVGVLRSQKTQGGIKLFLPAAAQNRLKQLYALLLAPFLDRSSLLTRALHPTVRSYLIGLVTTLLPCGWLYAFLAVAAASGSAMHAVGVMLTFWLGTLPAMVATGGLIHRFGKQWLGFSPRLAPILLILAGLFSLATHLQPSEGCEHNRTEVRALKERSPAPLSLFPRQ